MVDDVGATGVDAKVGVSDVDVCELAAIDDESMYIMVLQVYPHTAMLDDGLEYLI
jgi:hypothetical protein